MNRHVNRSNCLSSIFLSMIPVMVAILPAPAAMYGQEQVSALPEAEAVLEQYVIATGGRAAYGQVQNRVTRSTMEIVNTGITITMTAFQEKAGRFYTVVESAATGKIETGFDGTAAWELSAMKGPQLKEGRERDFLIHTSRLDRLAYWQEVYTGVECTGIEEVAGRPCYKVAAAWSGGNPESLYFDCVTHLLVKISLVVENTMGSIPFDSFLDDYRDVGGVRLPHRSRVLVMGQERIAVVNSVVQNEPLPPGRFQLPDEIRKIVEKNKPETTKQ